MPTETTEEIATCEGCGVPLMTEGIDFDAIDLLGDSCDREVHYFCRSCRDEHELGDEEIVVTLDYALTGGVDY